MQPTQLVTQPLLRGGVFGVLGRIAYYAVQFFTHVAAARLLGASGYGILQVAITLGVLVALAGRVGIPRVISRFLPVYVEERDGPRAAALVRWALRWSLLLGSTLAMALILAAGAIEIAMGEPPLGTTTAIVGVAIPFANLVMLFGATGLALGKIRYELLPQQLIQPLAFLSTIVIMALGDVQNAAWAAVGYTFSWFVALLAVLIAGRALIPAKSAVRPHWREWMTFAMPVSVVDLLDRARDWAEIFVAAIFLPMALVGPYAAAVRIAVLPGVFLISFNAIFAPRIAAHYALGRLKLLREEYARVTYTALLLTAPTAIAISFAGTELLTIFGKEFSQAGLALTILLAGQVANVAVGSTSYLIMMTGRPGRLLPMILISLTINLLLAFWLVPRFGMVGAAVANAGSLIVLNAMQFSHVYRTLHVHPYNSRYLVLLVALIAAAAFGGLAQSIFEEPFAPGGAIAAAVFIGTFAACFVPLGLWRGSLADNALSTSASGVEAN